MSLSDGYTDVPRGKLATVSTFIEMLEPPDQRLVPGTTNGAPVRTENPQPDWYRQLFRRIGEPYLWVSRLTISDEDLMPIIHDSRIEVYTAGTRGSETGFMELDFRHEGECKIAYFGVVKSAIGTGLGRKLMNLAIQRAWSSPIHRLWTHTCTLDHQNALPFYIRSGFHPYKRQIEVYDDPRLTGYLPRTAAPEVPLV